MYHQKVGKGTEAEKDEHWKACSDELDKKVKE